MHWGESFLNELSKRGSRYGKLSYEEHQLLKDAESERRFRQFLADKYPEFKMSGVSPAAVARLFAERWKVEELDASKGILVAGLMSGELGLLILIAISPFLLVRWVVSKLRSK